MESKEGDDGSNGDSAVECGRQNVVVLLPPGEVVFAHIDLEEPGDRDSRPRVRQIVRCPVKGSTDKDRNVDSADDLVIRESAGEEVEWQGEECTDEEAEDEYIVRASRSVHAAWAESSPNDGSSEEGRGSWAVELGLCIRCADTADASDLPI